LQTSGARIRGLISPRGMHVGSSCCTRARLLRFLAALVPRRKPAGRGTRGRSPRGAHARPKPAASAARTRPCPPAHVGGALAAGELVIVIGADIHAIALLVAGRLLHIQADVLALREAERPHILQVRLDHQQEGLRAAAARARGGRGHGLGRAPAPPRQRSMSEAARQPQWRWRCGACCRG
jgi:hypothetical protein